MSDLNSLEGAIDPAERELADLARSLASDPKTRRQFLQLVKTKNPEQPIPELDLAAQMEAFAKPHLDKLSAMEQQILKERAEANVLAKRNDLKGKYGYTDEDVNAIEKLMIEKQIGSHDTAAEFYRNTQQVATPTPSTFSQVQMPVKGKEVKEAGGIRKWAMSEAFKAVDDIKAGRVKLAS